MSSYVVTGDDDPFVVVAGIYELRILAIDFVSNDTASHWIGVYTYTGTTTSGGTVCNISKLRPGSPNPSATSSKACTLSGGTGSYIAPAYVQPNEAISGMGTSNVLFPGSSTAVQTPLTFTIPPGSLLRVSGLAAPGNLLCTVYFEELRLAGSY